MDPHDNHILVGEPVFSAGSNKIHYFYLLP